METSQIERGQQWLEKLIALAGIPANVQAQVTEVAGEESTWLVIDPEGLAPAQIAALTGPHGTVLDSIQYLTNAILNLGEAADKPGAFTIELNGYRLQRYAELTEIAEQAAATVRETGQEYELKSLSSAERRQVHTILKAFADIATFSRGQEPDRRLVISLARPPVESAS